MPLFKSNSTRREPSPTYQETSHSSGGLFGRNRTPSPARSSGSSLSGNTRGSGGGFLGFGRNRLDNDPSILSARQKVMEAEHAEREADRALLAARQTVREARDTIKILEQEAIDDARRAKAKQAEAKTIHKSTKRLGRHGA